MLNPAVGKLLIRVELNFVYNSFTVNNTSATGFTDPAYYTMIETTKQFITSVTPQVIYNVYNTSLFKAYIGAGVTINYSVYPSNKTVANFGVLSVTTNDYPELKNFYFIAPFRAGVVLNKKIEIYGSYFLKTEIANEANFSGYLTSYAVGVNYLFGNASK